MKPHSLLFAVSGGLWLWLAFYFGRKAWECDGGWPVTASNAALVLAVLCIIGAVRQ